MIVGLAGKAGSGKDEVASILIRDHGFTRVAFADVLKQVALDLDPRVGGITRLSHIVNGRGGWDEAKKYPEVRRTLQNLGVAIRAVDANFWVRNSGLETLVERGVDVVVSDVRFPNEAQYICAQPEGVMYRVYRPSTSLTGENGDHSSETELDKWLFPQINNSGLLANLSDEVERIL